MSKYLIFVGRHGEKVLTIPVQEGFNRTAWLIPVLGICGGLVVVLMVVRVWAKRSKEEAPVDVVVKKMDPNDPYLKELDKEMYGS